MDKISSLFQIITFTFITLVAQINPGLNTYHQHISQKLASPVTKISQIKPTIAPKLIEAENEIVSTPTAILEITETITPTISIPSPTLTKVPTPTQKPSPTPTKTPTPTKIPTPTPTSVPTITPTPIQPTPTPLPVIINLPSPFIPQAPSSLNADYIFSKINLHRSTINLTPFEKNSQLCNLADARASEIYNEIFITEKYHSGLYSRQLPYWITENIASFQTEDSMINWWLSDYIHRIAIEGNFKYSCVSCSGNSCVQLFTSFTHK